MNKKIQLILVPALAVIFSIIFWNNNAVFFNNKAESYSSVHNGVPHHTPVPGIQKKSGHHVNAKFRIKAWDDAIAVNCNPVYTPCYTIVVFSEVVYGGYVPHKLSAYYSSSGLRGPPEV
jgi:hypothetical protein